MPMVDNPSENPRLNEPAGRPERQGIFAGCRQLLHELGGRLGALQPSGRAERPSRGKGSQVTGISVPVDQGADIFKDETGVSVPVVEEAEIFKEVTGESVPVDQEAAIFGEDAATPPR
jgi:hypothetical protein